MLSTIFYHRKQTLNAPGFDLIIEYCNGLCTENKMYRECLKPIYIEKEHIHIVSEKKVE